MAKIEPNTDTETYRECPNKVAKVSFFGTVFGTCNINSYLTQNEILIMWVTLYSVILVNSLMQNHLVVSSANVHSSLVTK